MNIIDKAVIFISPSLGLRRMVARQKISMMNSLVGARKDTNWGKMWNTFSSENADDELLWDIETIRDRARDLHMNEPIPSGAILTNKLSIIGNGQKLQSTINSKYLGLSTTKSQNIQDNIEMHWDNATMSKMIDVAGQKNIHELATTALVRMLVDGDSFIVISNSKSDFFPYRMRLQVVDGARVRNKDNAIDSDFLSGGVQRDSNGFITHYHIHTQSKEKGSSWRIIPAYDSNTGLKTVLHLANDLDRPGLSRGLSYFTPIIAHLKNLGKYSEAELTAAVVSAFFTVILTTPEIGAADNYGEKIDQLQKARDKRPDIKLEPGSFVEALPGEKPEFANPTRPNANFDMFTTAYFKQLGVALGQPYEVLLKHFQSSYSAAKGALNQAWDFFYNKQNFMVENFYKPIYEYFVYELALYNLVNLPGFFRYYFIRKAYTGSIWQGPYMRSMEPLKEANAMKVLRDNFFSTTRSLSNQIGQDFEKNQPQIEIEQEFIKKHKEQAA